MRRRLSARRGPVVEILRDQPVEDAVGPAVAVSVGVAPNALALVPRQLRVRLRALVEALDLQLEAMEAQIADQMPLHQPGRLHTETPAAEAGIDGETAQIGDRRALVDQLEHHRARGL